MNAKYDFKLTSVESLLYINFDVICEFRLTHTFRSGFAISGRILQNGLITSKNLTEKRSNGSQISNAEKE